MTLAEQNIRANRSCKLNTFKSKGLPHISKLIQLNLEDLFQILVWNKKNNIKLYRMPEDLFPWKSEYILEDLPNFSLIHKQLAFIGNYVKNNNLKISFHPGPHHILVSPKKRVVDIATKSLINHARILQFMGFEPSPLTKINFHIGASYGQKQKSLETFVHSFSENIPDNLKPFFTIENDDKQNLYTVEDLSFIHEELNIPIVFDYHHHRLNPGNLSLSNALLYCISTWPKYIKPTFHYSDEYKIYEDTSANNFRRHANYIHNIPETFGLNFDIMFESKAKDLSVLKFIDSLNKNKNKNL